jgi:hypothetical protein
MNSSYSQNPNLLSFEAMSRGGTVPSESDDLREIREPWRCDECECLQYNTEFFPATKKESSKLYAVQGAPPPKYLSSRQGQVCWLCFQMYQIAYDNRYFRKLHDEYLAEQKKRKEQINKMKPGNDYFTGA